MNIEKELKTHFEEDRINFKKIEDRFLEVKNSNDKQNETLNTILVHVKTTNEFMENLEGINNVVKGTRLLKTPSLWLIALVVGIVALFGGIKSLLTIFITPR